MAVERGFIDYTTYRQDAEPYLIEMFTSINEDEANFLPMDILATYDEIVMEVRSKEDFNSRLVKSLSYSNGDFVILNTNEIHFNLSNDLDPRLYYYDMRFRELGTTNWQTLVSGTLQNITNISEV